MLEGSQGNVAPFESLFSCCDPLLLLAPDSAEMKASGFFTSRVNK